MIKINVSYSKKVPVPGQQFSSMSFHASLERELSDGLQGEVIQKEFQKGYALLEQTVENEIIRYTGTPAKAETVFPDRAIQKGDATEKQLSLINRRGAEKGMSSSQLNTHIMNSFPGKETVGQLSKKEASQLIDYLGNLQKAA